MTTNEAYRPSDPIESPPSATDKPAKRGFRFPQLRQGTLMPEAGAAGAPLTAVLAVISALAALALAAFVLIAQASDAWTAELQASLTVQVKGTDLEEIAARTKIAEDILNDTPGVLGFDTMTSAEAARLLEPWLGRGNAGDLNVPALIEIRASPVLRADLAPLRQSLETAAPGIVLDDHGDWNDRLTRAARSGQALAFGIFALIMAAAAAIAVFAARAGLAANAEIVSLLHLVGATDDFIANEVQRRFLIIGLRGSLVGLVIAMFAIGLAALAARARGSTAYLLPSVDLGIDLLIPMLIVPIGICIATAVTARSTVLRSLREAY